MNQGPPRARKITPLQATQEWPGQSGKCESPTQFPSSNSVDRNMSENVRPNLEPVVKMKDKLAENVAEAWKIALQEQHIDDGFYPNDGKVS
jgi:hypothetical protein